MKDDAVIKDNEAVYLINEQTYLHLRENIEGIGYEVFKKVLSRWKRGRFRGRFWGTVSGALKPPVSTIWQNISMILW